MKKRLVRWMAVLLSLVVFATGAAAATVTRIMIVSVDAKGDSLAITYRLNGAVTGQEITCLVYEPSENGRQGSLLQAVQADAPGDGIHTLTVSVQPSSKGYLVFLGGTNSTAVRSVALTKEYQSDVLGITGETTVGDLSAELAALTDVAVLRNEQPLSAADRLLPGDRITAGLNGTSVAFWAVIYGDVDLDGQVNAADALLVLRHAVGKTQLSGASLGAADFVQNGVIDASSALSILKFAVGKQSVL